MKVSFWFLLVWISHYVFRIINIDPYLSVCPCLSQQLWVFISMLKTTHRTLHWTSSSSSSLLLLFSAPPLLLCSSFFSAPLLLLLFLLIGLVTARLHLCTIVITRVATERRPAPSHPVLFIDLTLFSLINDFITAVFGKRNEEKEQLFNVSCWWVHIKVNFYRCKTYISKYLVNLNADASIVLVVLIFEGTLRRCGAEGLWHEMKLPEMRFWLVWAAEN